MQARSLSTRIAPLYPALRWFWIVIVFGLLLSFLYDFVYSLFTGGPWEPTRDALRFLDRFGGTLALFLLLLGLLTLQAWSSHRRQIDPVLLGTAKIVDSPNFQIGRDVVVQEFRQDVEIIRSVEQLARTALRDRGAVILIGRPKSGKTRLAAKLVKEYPNATIVMPRVDEPPQTFNALGLQGRDLILLFDDLHLSAETMKPLLWKQRLDEATGRRCLVICTARDGNDWERIERRLSAFLDSVGRDAAFAHTSRVGPAGEDLSLEQGQELAAALAIDEAAFARRFDGTPGSLSLDLADMRRRYRGLRDEVRGPISMSRLLDSAKLLNAARQPRLQESLLRTAAERIRGAERISNENWDALRRRTEQEGFGQIEDGILRIYAPYLEQCVEYTPTTGDLESLLPLFEESDDLEGAFYLGVALQEIGSPVAEQADRFAAAGGIAAAFNNLGFVLVQQGRLEEAERVLRTAMAAGISDAYVQMGRLLTGQRGREGEAEAIFRDAVALGFPEGYRNLGFFLSKQGRTAEAEAVYREALRAGDSSVWFGLASLLSEQVGREDEVEEAYRNAAALGDIGAQNNLGHLLMDQGRWDDAEREFAIAIANGSADARNNLGKLRVKQGRLTDAENEFRAASSSGNPTATYNLGVVLAKLGKKVEAESAYRAAIGASIDNAWFALGNLLAGEEGREAEAEEALRMAAARNIPDAKNNLGILLSRQGDRKAAAIEAYREAVDSGNTKALRNLAIALFQQPDKHREAEEYLRQAIQQDVKGAWGSLGDLLLLQSRREDEAEDAYRAAIEEVEVRAFANLGMLLERLDRVEEAEQAYRSGYEAGSVEAGYNLALLLANQPERQDESEQVSMELIADGKADGFNSLGVLYATQGRSSEAEEAFDKAIIGGDTSAYMNLGIMFSGESGRQVEAERNLRTALSHGHAAANFHLGMLLLRQRDRAEEALQALEAAQAAGHQQASVVLDSIRGQSTNDADSVHPG